MWSWFVVVTLSTDPLQEMIEAIREAVVYMAYTHDGARVAMHCLWHGTPKACAHAHAHTHTHTHTHTRCNVIQLM